jgi:hypothetical protein
MSDSPQRYSSNSESFIQNGRKQLIALAVILIIAAGGLSYKIATNNGSVKIEAAQDNKFLNQVGQSLIDHHENSGGGWRFKSSIQAPHYQTDRDVGAAGVGMGFLSLAEAEPQNSQWLDGAEHTASWLIAVSSQDGKGGRYWPDYVDDNETSSDIYTSFDDGSVGVGDFFWQLYEKTDDPRYKQIYIETLDWTLSQAEPYQKDGLNGFRWKWNVTDPHSAYYMGMGEGAAGITDALATGYQRLKYSDPAIANRCKMYMKGSLSYIEIVKQELAKNIGSSPTIPETGVNGRDGDTVMDSGYLSGAAGDSFMYLSLYKIFGDKDYLNRATGLLNWLSDNNKGPLVKVAKDSFTWRLAVDPQDGNDNRFATGFEEGNAGIGWVFLQAYKLTGDKSYLQTADAAGNWLLSVAVKIPGGTLSWHEAEHPKNSLIHANLNNGAAGIGMFLRDLYMTNGSNKFKDAAGDALKGLMSSAKYNGKVIYWQDNGGNDPYSDDPSWHWGLAGIAEFAQRIHGGAQDIPGEQPAFR